MSTIYPPENQQSPSQPPPEVGPPPRRTHRARKVLLILGGAFTALIALIVILAVATGSKPATTASTSTTPPPAATSAPAPATSQPATSQPATSQPATSAPAAPAGLTGSQQQALDSASSYLDLGTGFSRSGLIDQLSSPYGGKFSVADATWAADHSGADWNAQAVMSAKGYMNLGTGFSRSGLIDQLSSPYGGKFTLAQATYAVNQVGL
jgi:3-oxoacyl-ACP reductase-like protein